MKAIEEDQDWNQISPLLIGFTKTSPRHLLSAISKTDKIRTTLLGNCHPTSRVFLRVCMSAFVSNEVDFTSGFIFNIVLA